MFFRKSPQVSEGYVEHGATKNTTLSKVISKEIRLNGDLEHPVAASHSTFCIKPEPENNEEENVEITDTNVITTYNVKRNSENNERPGMENEPPPKRSREEGQMEAFADVLASCSKRGLTLENCTFNFY